MTSIANSSAIQLAAVQPEMSAVVQDRKQLNPAKTATETPSTIVSFSSKATSASSSSRDNLLTLDPDKVNNALSGLSAANGAAFIASHFNTAGIAAKFGEEFALRAKEGTISTSYNTISNEAATATESGVRFQSSIKSVDGVKAYAASGSSSPIISVPDFSFKSGGSIYSIINQPDGTLLGTKDGQAWQTWQLTSVNAKTNFGPAVTAAASTSGAASAIQALASLTTHNAVAKTMVPLNVSA